MKKIIYVADDDINISNLLKTTLENEGYIVETFLDGEKLLSRFKTKPSDIILTDIMMPIMNGYELCKNIRTITDVPIIMLSAKDEEIDKILGLELGSDDYISKPFSLREITIKIKNILKRSQTISTLDPNVVYCKNLKINKENREILIDNKPMSATTKEYDLLELLILNKNKAFSRDTIINNVWGYDYYSETRQVDNLVKRLREKLLKSNSLCTIETIWGFGYKVVDNENIQ